MSRDSLEQFRQRIIETPALQEQLLGVPDQGSVVKLLVQLGKENGYSFTADEVTEAIGEIRQQQELKFPLDRVELEALYRSSS